MTDDMLNDIAGLLALTGAVPIAGATITYGIGSPWWRSWLGRVMFGLFFALVIVFGIVLGRRLGGEYPGYGWVALVGYAYIWLTLWAVWLIILVERRKPAPSGPLPLRKETINMGDPTEGGQHVAITTATVPEIWFKAKRAVRTIVQTLIVLVPIANALAAAVIGYLNTQTDVTVPGWVFIALNGIVVATALLAGLVARVMAVPGVNAWLVKIGLGSVPAAAVARGQV